MTHAHLSDEQLSAHLDGERPDGPSPATPDGGIEADIAGCDVCRDRRAALADTRALLRRPVAPVAPSVRAAAVEAALATGLGTEAGPGSVSTLLPRPKRPARATGVLVGVAAAAAVLVVAVGVSLGLSHTGSGPAASSAMAHAPARAAAPEPTTTSPGGLPDLGSVSATNLRSRIAPVVDSQNHVTGTSAGSSDAGVPGQENATAAPTSSSSSPAAPAGCVASAQQAAGTAGYPELVATATYARMPAYVFVVPVGGASSTTSEDEAVVVAESGCRVLAHILL
jgi:hypothetical protein